MTKLMKNYQLFTFLWFKLLYPALMNMSLFLCPGLLANCWWVTALAYHIVVGQCPCKDYCWVLTMAYLLTFAGFLTQLRLTVFMSHVFPQVAMFCWLSTQDSYHAQLDYCPDLPYLAGLLPRLPMVHVYCASQTAEINKTASHRHELLVKLIYKTLSLYTWKDSEIELLNYCDTIV